MLSHKDCPIIAKRMIATRETLKEVETSKVTQVEELAAIADELPIN